MKTCSFLLCLFFLVSCGKDNSSGSRPPGQDQIAPDAFRSEAVINQVQITRNGVMVQGNVANFAIPVSQVTNYYYSRNLIGVIYEDQGLRVRIYNSMGHMVLVGDFTSTNIRLNIRDDIAGLEYQTHRGSSRYIAVSTTQRLLDVSADDIHGEVKHGVAAVVYRNDRIERVIAVKADGRVLVPDHRTYVRPRFTIDPYDLILSHTQGIEHFPH